jgi:hypothetical protein
MARWPALLLVSLLVLSTCVQGASTIPIKEMASGIGASDQGWYGYKVLRMKDFDGDGIMDIAVSAPQDSSGGSFGGAIYIIKGPFNAGSDLSAAAASTVLRGYPGEQFGQSMDTGDFNGDGLSDLIVGVPRYEINMGAAFVFLGGNTTNRTDRQADATFKGTWQGEWFGVSVANIGNLNGDRFDDFAVTAGGSNYVYVFTGREHLTTEVIDLPEVPQDYPNPVDFTHGINATGNTFGLGNVTDGWDWKAGIYNGTSTDVVFSPVGGAKPYAEVILGSLTNGNDWNPCPAASGGFGVEFNITQETIDAMQDGAQVHLKFTWTASNTWLNQWVGEVYWIKARVWNSTVNQTWLGYSMDGDTNFAGDDNADAVTDATNELYYNNWGQGSNQKITYVETPDSVINDVIDGAHPYYLDVGGKLSDWHGLADFVSIQITNVTVYSQIDPIAIILGPEWASINEPIVTGAGDVNGDGYDDLLVGYPGNDQTCIYYGSPHFGQDFNIYGNIAFPERQGKNDTTDEPNVNDLSYNDGSGWPPTTGWYTVDRGQVMAIDGWDTGDAKGELLYAYLYAHYLTDWQYNGNDWLRFSIDDGAWQQTGLKATQSWGTDFGPDDMYIRGVKTLPQLQTMRMEFNNTATGGGGARAVYFDYIWMYFITQMAANLTISGLDSTNFGVSVSGLDSINGDPYDDFIIGAPNTNSVDGAAYVFIGGKDLQGNLTQKDAFATFYGTKGSKSMAGYQVGSAGLFSLDKFPDIAIGSLEGNGTMYVVRGGPRLESGYLSEVAQYSFEGETPSSNLPQSIAPMGDINGGHCGEILTSDIEYNNGIIKAGKVYILYNSDEDLLKQPLLIDYHPKGDQTMKEQETLAFGVEVRAPADLAITYRWTLDGSTVGIAQTGFTYQPGYGTAGKHKLSVYVSDGYREATVQWNITVEKVNFPPKVTFYPTVDPTINEGDAVRFWAEAVDPDGDVLAYSWTYDGNAVAGTADPGFVVRSDHTMAGDHMVSLDVSDGEFSFVKVWDLMILDVNQPPVIDTASPVSDPTIESGQSQDFNITAHDPDKDPLTVVWSVDGQSTALGTYAYELTTEAGKVKTHTVLVRVSDGQYTVEHKWILTASKGNQGPIIDWVRPSSPVQLDDGGAMVFWLTAHDPDGDKITTNWTLDGTRVIGEQSYDFRVPANPKGAYVLVATVTDGKLDASYTWDIKVNRAPSIIQSWPFSGRTLSSGKTVEVGITAMDADKDEMTLTWYVNDKTVLAELIPSSQNGGNSDIQFMAPFDSVNDINIKVVVTDGRLSTETQWKFNVTKVSNTPPTALIKISPAVPKKGKAMDLDGSGSTDPEGDIISYEWSFSDGTVAHGATVSKTFNSKGPLTVKLTVTDSKGNVAQATNVLSFGGSKVQNAAESPLYMILFIVLLVVMVVLIVYQSFRKGWIGPKKDRDDDYKEDLASRKADLDKAPPKEEEMEPDEEGHIEGGFEELPIDEDTD